MPNPLSFADEKKDLAVAFELIEIVESDIVGQAREGQELFDSISEESKIKPIAAYALAVIQIRDGKYSEALNRPAPPVHPGPQPRQPYKPDGSYKIDPKTQERKYVPPSNSEEKRYKDELEQFKSWPTRSQKYQKDMAEYPAKSQLWEQRIASLQMQKKDADEAVASAEIAMKEMQAKISQGIGNALKQTGDQLEQLERLAPIGRDLKHSIQAYNLE